MKKYQARSLLSTEAKAEVKNMNLELDNSFKILQKEQQILRFKNKISYVLFSMYASNPCQGL